MRRLILLHTARLAHLGMNVVALAGEREYVVKGLEDAALLGRRAVDVCVQSRHERVESIESMLRRREGLTVVSGDTWSPEGLLPYWDNLAVIYLVSEDRRAFTIRASTYGRLYGTDRVRLVAVAPVPPRRRFSPTVVQ